MSDLWQMPYWDHQPLDDNCVLCGNLIDLNSRYCEDCYWGKPDE